MQKPKIFFSSLIIGILITGCEQPSSTLMQSPQASTEISSLDQNISYRDQLSQSILNIINSPDETNFEDDLIREQEIISENVKHYLFYSAIDKTGSAPEEVLEHDGYTSAHKYVVHWREVMAENGDWPDHKSTTFPGPKTALEHGLLKNGKGWFTYKNAAQKADEYFLNAINAWKKDAAPDAPEQKEAWAWLARTSHFIQDLTVPHHTVPLTNVGQITHVSFEMTAAATFSDYFPSKNYNGGGVWTQKGPYPADGKWGIYFENKNPSEIIKNNADIVRGLYKISNNPKDAKNGNWDKVRSLMLPIATKTTAGLIVNFLNRVGVNPS